MHNTPGFDDLAAEMREMPTFQLREWLAATTDRYTAARLRAEIRRRSEEGFFNLTAYGRGETDK